ncbi:MAG: lamin tail domain-containing protein [Candidatus Dojkabacteria bacterium]
MKYIFIILLFLLIPLKTIVSANESGIFISEIFPDAIGADSGKEWIELYNNSISAIDIKDYYFINKSATGTERRINITQSVIIPPHEYFIIAEASVSIPSENITLLGAGRINMFNDEADLVIYRPDGTAMDNIHYPKPTEGKSLERKGPIDTSDCSILVPHPTANTIFTDNAARSPLCFGETSPISFPVVPTTDSCIALEQVVRVAVESQICTRGYVTVEENILGDKVFYIQDGNTGLKIKMKSDQTIVLHIGDKLEINGTLKSIRDGIYVYTDTVTVIPENRVVYPNTLINNFEIEKSSLVTYKGEIQKNYSKSFDLKFEGSTIRVSVLASTNIDIPTKSVGDTAEVTGILVEDAGIFKILPRYSEDIVITEEEENPVEAIVSTVPTTKPQSGIDNKSVVSSSIISTKSKSIINQQPSLSIIRLEFIPVEKVVKYKVSKAIYLLGGIIFILLIIIFLKRKWIRERIMKLLKSRKAHIDKDIANQKALFSQDKYELMFGE